MKRRKPQSCAVNSTERDDLGASGRRHPAIRRGFPSVLTFIIMAVMAIAAVTIVIVRPGLAQAGTQPARVTSSIVSADGISVESVTRRSPRLLDIAMKSTAVAMSVHVDVLLPSSYQPATRRYPTIYLLAGGNASNYTGNEYQTWVDGNVAKISQHAEAIIVMPEAGADGWYTNWYNHGLGGTPEWETFHVTQLVPWIDHNFATIPDRAHRAIAGASMGGFGALSYAARHPDVYSVAASFSGGADLTNPSSQIEPLVTPLIDLSAPFDGGNSESVFGSHQDNEIGWQAHDPARLADNLRNTRLFLYTGHGTPGPTSYTPGGIEAIIHTLNVQFHNVLHAAGIPSVFDDYPGGTHSVTYFERDLTNALPQMMARLDHPSVNVAPPFTFKTDLPSYSTWGWSVAITSAAPEFSTLTVRQTTRFTLVGSGVATVVTPARFKPFSRYRVTVQEASGRSSKTATSDGNGRLHISVDLGPSSPYQEFTSAAAASGGTKTYQATIAVSH
jgi:S-formylglutathione hydrolase FrmB